MESLRELSGTTVEVHNFPGGHGAVAASQQTTRLMGRRRQPAGEGIAAHLRSGASEPVPRRW
jgi:tripartite-type tricarboxylate transporter receptor subunit TctC